MDKIVVFETFYNPIEANIVKARLMDSGVQCFLSDENTITINPLYTQALGGVKLHIFEKDIPLVKDILQDENIQLPQEETEPGVEICPNCGSNHVGYVQATKKRFNLLTMIVSFALMIYPFYAKKTRHCFDCEHEF
nr:DUF2007 domain-containing protein [uncultured Pedobacter sp.]